MALTRVLSLANNRAALLERAMHMKSLLKLHAYAKVSKAHARLLRNSFLSPIIRNTSCSPSPITKMHTMSSLPQNSAHMLFILHNLVHYSRIK